jgi:hypothetical protein
LGDDLGWVFGLVDEGVEVGLDGAAERSRMLMGANARSFQRCTCIVPSSAAK